MGTDVFGNSTRTGRLNEYDREAIFYANKGGASTRELARDYRRCLTTIQRIITKERLRIDGSRR